jgi:hypothetical protein
MLNQIEKVRFQRKAGLIGSRLKHEDAEHLPICEIITHKEI